MGRKGRGLYINPKKFGQNRPPCTVEMVSFLSCLAINQNNDDKCVKEKNLLMACVDAQSGKKKKPWGTINYHLQRLSKGKNSWIILFVDSVGSIVHFTRPPWPLLAVSLVKCIAGRYFFILRSTLVSPWEIWISEARLYHWRKQWSVLESKIWERMWGIRYLNSLLLTPVLETSHHISFRQCP